MTVVVVVVVAVGCDGADDYLVVAVVSVSPPLSLLRFDCDMIYEHDQQSRIPAFACQVAWCAKRRSKIAGFSFLRRGSGF